jgi:hypothetical protein
LEHPLKKSKVLLRGLIICLLKIFKDREHMHMDFKD